MSGKAGEVAVVDVLGHGFPGRLAVFVDGDAPKVVGATCLTKFRPIAGLCAMRKVLGYVWLKSLPPLRYESVQTVFVPKTHADAGLFLLLKAAELSREWQKEIVVVLVLVWRPCGSLCWRWPCGSSAGRFSGPVLGPGAFFLRVFSVI